MPRAVLFHTIAIHCHNGMDDNDASFFVLGSELLVYPNSKFQLATKDRETHKRDGLSRRKYSRRRHFSQDIAILVDKV